jgi:hypothetical protein
MSEYKPGDKIKMISGEYVYTKPGTVWEIEAVIEDSIYVWQNSRKESTWRISKSHCVLCEPVKPTKGLALLLWQIDQLEKEVLNV